MLGSDVKWCDKSADWSPPNYHKTARMFPYKLCASLINKKADSKWAVKNKFMMFDIMSYAGTLMTSLINKSADWPGP